MKLLIHGINFSPELTGIGKYSGEMAAWLAAQGVEVRVVTAPPYYPQWQVQPGYRAGRYAVERSTCLKVIRCPLWVPRKVTGKKRLLHLTSFALSSLPALLWEGIGRPAVVMAVEPTFFGVPLALATARLYGAKAWLHVQDLEVDAAASLGILPAGRIMDAVLGAESWIMRRFDVVSTISEKMRQRIIQKGVDPARVVRLDNWVDTAAIRPLDETPALRKELGVEPGRMIALYSGNMGEKQGLEILVEAARQLRDLPLDFVLCGDGAARRRLQAAAADLPQVRFRPLVPFDQLAELLNCADMHLVPQRAEIEDLVLPSKLTGILASGGPAVVSAKAGTELAQVVAAAGGQVVEPGDVAAFAGAVRSLAADPQRRAAMGHQAREGILEIGRAHV